MGNITHVPPTIVMLQTPKNETRRAWLPPLLWIAFFALVGCEARPQVWNSTDEDRLASQYRDGWAQAVAPIERELLLSVRVQPEGGGGGRSPAVPVGVVPGESVVVWLRLEHVHGGYPPPKPSPAGGAGEAVSVVLERDDGSGEAVERWTLAWDDGNEADAKSRWRRDWAVTTGPLEAGVYLVRVALKGEAYTKVPPFEGVARTVEEAANAGAAPRPGRDLTPPPVRLLVAPVTLAEATAAHHRGVRDRAIADTGRIVNRPDVRLRLDTDEAGRVMHDARRHQATGVLENRSLRVILIRGDLGSSGPDQNPIHPWNSYDEYRPGGFEAKSVGWFCGTGLGYFRVEPGESRPIVLTYRDPGIVRFSVPYRLSTKERNAETYVVHSAPIEAVAEEEAKP